MLNLLPSETFRLTLEKLEALKIELANCISIQDYASAKDAATALMSYDRCHYCTSYRRTLASIQVPGVCDFCPLHRYGESLAGRRVAQNGCYQSPEYRQMVRAAHWLHEEPSLASARDLIQKIITTINKLNEIKSLVCENVT